MTDPIPALLSIDPAAVAARGEVRRQTRPQKAAAIRQLFRALGVRGVRVTCGKSWISPVRVAIPRPAHLTEREEAGLDRHDWEGCPVCARSREAQERAARIVLAAYPDMDDRSDSRTDYFDAAFIVEAA